MVSLSNFQTKLNSKIWSSDVASTVSVVGLGSSTVDDYGEVYWTRSAGTIAYCVPYNTFQYQKNIIPWGDPKSGQTDMVFPYETDIARDYVVVDSNIITKSYIVAAVENFPYGGGNLAKAARLTEQIVDN